MSRRAKKHRWIRCEYDKRRIDVFAAESSAGFHNGPKCADCGFEFCHHCNPEGYKTYCGTPSVEPNDSNLDPVMVALDRSVRRALR